MITKMQLLLDEMITKKGLKPINVSGSSESIYFEDENTGQEFVIGLSMVPQPDESIEYLTDKEINEIKQITDELISTQQGY